MANIDSLHRLVRRSSMLEELLADDVTQAVMRADHVAAPEVRGLCNAVGALIAGSAGGRGAGRK